MKLADVYAQTPLKGDRRPDLGLRSEPFKQAVIGEIPESWAAVGFEECLEPEVRHVVGKLQTNAYASAGRYPIIDQGQTPVAGYTDDESLAYRGPLPVVIFGDHTRVFKFVSEAFVLGADGTKILHPNGNRVDARFFYYALTRLSIPSRGYNRHYKLLREQWLAIPGTMEEQQTIAAVLSKIQAAVEAQDKIIATLKELKAATMAKLFHEGLRGEPLKQTAIGEVPQSWELWSLESIGKLVTGTTPATSRPEYYGDDVPFISPGDIGDGRLVRKAEKKLSRLGVDVSRPLPARTVLVVCIGSTIGKVGMTTASVSCTNQQINAIICKEEFIPECIYYIMVWNSDRVRTLSTPSPVPILSKGTFAKGVIAVPSDKYEQEKIAQVLCAIDDRIEKAEEKRDTLKTLFSSMLHLLMTGQVRVTSLMVDGSRGRPVHNRLKEVFTQ